MTLKRILSECVLLDSSLMEEAQTCMADLVKNESVIWLMGDKLTRKASSNRT